jgi:PAS domain S-box-containing protein
MTTDDLHLSQTIELAKGMSPLDAFNIDYDQAIDTLEHLFRRNELIIRSSGEGIFGLDAQGHLTFMNPTAETLLGYRIEEVMNKQFHDLIHHSTSKGTPFPKENCPICKTLQDGLFRHQEEDIFWRKDGTYFPVKYNCTAIIVNGQISGAVVTFQDTTERTLVENALWQRTITLGKRVKELNCLYNISNLLQEKDKPLPEILQGILDLLPTAWQQPDEICLCIAVDHQTFQTENYQQTNQKQQVNILLDGNPIGYIEVGYLKTYAEFDLNSFYEEKRLIQAVAERLGQTIARIQSEERLKQALEQAERLLAQSERSEQLLREVIDASPDWIFVKNLDLRYVLVNKSYAAALGMKSEEIIGRNENEIARSIKQNNGKPYQGFQAFNEASKVALQGQTIHNPETHLTKLDGSTLFLDAHFIPLCDSHGNIYGVLGIARDVTERKEWEHKLQQWNEELERRVRVRTEELEAEIFERKKAEKALAQQAQDLARSNADLEQFAYIASHDLQEPLRMISSYLQLLERRYKDRLDDDAREFIAFAVDGAIRMKSLINDLLTYSRIGTHPPDFKLVDSEMVLKRSLTHLKLSIEENQAIITFDSLPHIIADEVQLEQLFRNLISNALKFRGQDPPQIHIGCQRRERDDLFWVKDNGIGIEPQFADRIFVIFQRLHTIDEYPGTGIGLAISKRIVERHNGRIWVESEPGKGSTFYFTIPKPESNSL